jgi:hypothetical protein
LIIEESSIETVDYGPGKREAKASETARYIAASYLYAEHCAATGEYDRPAETTTMIEPKMLGAHIKILITERILPAFQQFIYLKTLGEKFGRPTDDYASLAVIRSISHRSGRGFVDSFTVLSALMESLQALEEDIGKVENYPFKVCFRANYMDKGCFAVYVCLKDYPEIPEKEGYVKPGWLTERP